jgi:aryl-phospho-beta-D-glucosidase BglC (GH1 family)
MQDKFVSYWDAVSSKLSQNKYVIGYDPLNEPTPSNPFKDPFLIEPHVFDRE